MEERLVCFQRAGDRWGRLNIPMLHIKLENNSWKISPGRVVDNILRLLGKK